MANGSNRLYSLAAALILALVASACGNARVDEISLGEGSAEEFVQLVKRDLTYSFEAFQTPKAALETTDLAISGTIVDAEMGMQIFRPNRFGSCDEQRQSSRENSPDEPLGGCVDIDEKLFGSYLTFHVQVEEVFGGDAVAGKMVEVQLAVPIISREEALKAAPRGRVVFLLEDATNWTPTDDARFVWPDGAARSIVYIPYADGAWMEGADGPVGPYAEVEELESLWKAEIDSLSDIEETLRNAG